MLRVIGSSGQLAVENLALWLIASKHYLYLSASPSPTSITILSW
jgi:hypothetical protein